MCVVLFQIASQKDKKTYHIIVYWLIIQAVLRITGIYSFAPPIFKFFFLILPPIFFIIYLFLNKKGKFFIDHIDAKFLTVIHIYRVSLQLIFYTLILNNTLPEIITPFYRNLEIVFGISALIIYYYGCVKKYIGRNLILIWNVLGLIILIAVIANTNFSSSSHFPFQKFKIDPENWISYFYFPVIWLPSFMVPLFIFAHLAIIRQIIILKEKF